MIFQWASEGNTAAEITRKLYAMNIPTPGEYRKLKGKDYYNVSRTNGVWSTSTVLRILEDQRYIGTYVIGKRKVKEIGSRHTQLKDESEWFKIPNHHPAIVSVDLFERANASIKRFSLSNKKPRDYLLRGKVFCGCCDHAMSLRNGAWFYCRHSEVAETLPCHGVRIKMADLEQVVFETIRAQMCPALGIDSNKDKLDCRQFSRPNMKKNSVLFKTASGIFMSSMHSERLIWKPIEHEKRFMTRSWYKPKMFMLSLLHRQSR